MVLKISKNIFITFGAGRSGWIGAAKRITTEAEKTDLFEFCFNLDEKWLKTWDPQIHAISQNLRDRLGPRGFGYWTWKPSVLYWADKYFPNHQIVYVDAGSEFARKPASSSLKKYLDNASITGGLAWQLKNHPEISWTKRELIEYLKCDYPQIQSDQIQSGFICLPPSADRTHFIEDWRDIALERKGFYFTDQIELQAHSEFIENRHDQSAFSCLWKKRGFSFLTTSEIDMYSLDFGIRPIRNNSGTQLESRQFRYIASKFRDLLKDSILRRR